MVHTTLSEVKHIAKSEILKVLRAKVKGQGALEILKVLRAQVKGQGTLIILKIVKTPGQNTGNTNIIACTNNLGQRTRQQLLYDLKNQSQETGNNTSIFGKQGTTDMTSCNGQKKKVR